MTQLASVGDFCPNPDCEYYGDIDAKSLFAMAKSKMTVNAISANP